MTIDSVAGFEVRFLEKLQRLLAEGTFTATYKFAVLLGLTELSVEAFPTDDTFTTRQLADKVAELYWPQVLPFDELELRHSGQQAYIVGAVEEFRAEATTPGSAAGPLSSARSRLPDSHERMIRRVERSLIFMPLPRLQELRSGTDEFIYHLGWTLADAIESSSGLRRRVGEYQRNKKGAFDNRIFLQPRVVPTLARFQGIIRELIEARWVRKIRELNGATLKERDLQKHLFGFEREQLAPLGGPLLELHAGRCFYCGDRVRKPHVDHFLPWARYPDNRLVNLVPAHEACNGSKSAFLASVEHLEHWLLRFSDLGLGERLGAIGTEACWPTGGQETLAVSRVLYSQQPEGGRLWYARGEFRNFEKAVVEASIDATIRARRVA